MQSSGKIDVSYTMYDSDNEDYVIDAGHFNCTRYPALIHSLWIPTSPAMMDLSYDFTTAEEEEILPDVSLKYTFYDQEYKIAATGNIDCSTKKSLTERILIPGYTLAMTISYRLKTEGEPDAIEQQTEESEEVYFLNEC